MAAKLDKVRVGFRGSEWDIPMTATQRNELGKHIDQLLDSAGEAVVVRRTGDAHLIREWAENNGHPGIMGKRGRISAEIRAEYTEAMKGTKKPATAKKAPAAKPTEPAAATAQQH